MKYYTNVNNQPHEVELIERLGKLHVKVDGREVDVDYCEADRLGQVAVLLEQKAYGASIEGGANEWFVTVAGHLYRVDIEDERERAAHAAERGGKKAGGLIKSVMPGVVVKLLVKEGQRVELDQPILILEAMKMQNEIKSPTAGVVKKLHVTEREAVSSGAKLAVIEG
jgi:biotin carboxyl carrier protein